MSTFTVYSKKWLKSVISNKLKSYRLALIVCFSANVAVAETRIPVADVSLRVVDVMGNPVEGATVIAGLLKVYEPGKIFRGSTKKDGQFSFSGQHHRGFSARITKDGFYETEVKDALQSQKIKEEDTTSIFRKVVLRKMLNPIAMFARGENLLVLPKTAVRTGYDLEVGDWVKPHGRGQKTDLFFTVEGTWESSANFDSGLKISFPNAGDGIVPFDAKLQHGSNFLSPYEAPVGGYASEFKWRFARIPRPENGADSIETINTMRADQHFILRVRTVLNEDGKVESCHYAKVYGPLEFDGVRPAGNSSRIRFQAQYLNPKSNDRNLEFAVGETLIENLPPAAETRLP